jgi:hypothetical protein
MPIRSEILQAGKPALQTAVRSHREVADIMTAAGYAMSAQRVLEIERTAIAKLRERADLVEVFESHFEVPR